MNILDSTLAFIKKQEEMTLEQKANKNAEKFTKDINEFLRLQYSKACEDYNKPFILYAYTESEQQSLENYVKQYLPRYEGRKVLVERIKS